MTSFDSQCKWLLKLHEDKQIQERLVKQYQKNIKHRLNSFICSSAHHMRVSRNTQLFLTFSENIAGQS